MNKKQLVILLLAGLWMYPSVAQEGRFKALFLVKFSEYIEWPSGNSDLTIGVVGNTDVFDELKRFTAQKANLSVINIQSASDSPKCDIIYVPGVKLKLIGELVSNIGSKSTLLVSDDGNQVKKGADIGFFVDGNKLRFILSKENIESKKMVPSSKLLALGKTI